MNKMALFYNDTFFMSSHLRVTPFFVLFYAGNFTLFFFVSLNYLSGMTVVGTAGSPQGMELVKNNGAHLVFNHRYTWTTLNHFPPLFSQHLNQLISCRIPIPNFRNVHSFPLSLC